MSEPSRRGAGRRPGRRSLRLKDVIVFGSLPVLLIGYLLTGAVIDYYHARQYDDWWSRGRVAKQFLQARLAIAVGMPRAVSLERGFDPESPDPGLVRLRVPRETWDAVLEDPLAGWGVWVDGQLIRADDAYRVELRKRGDTSVHWTTPKKSFTLKTRRDDLFKGFRRVGFTAKDVLPQYVSGTLAAQFDLMAPFTAISPVYLNDRFYGLYRFVEGVDESFLRRQRRLPGSVYRADAAERGEYFKGTERRAFANPAIWERVAESDGPNDPDHSAFRDFLSAVSGSTFADHLRLMELVDREEVARLIAAMLVVGDPYHMSNIHNQLWYLDPSTQTLHPIPWDLRVLDLADPPDQPLNGFLRAALRDPFVVDATLREVEARIAGGELQSLADSLAWTIWERYADYFAYEALRARAIPPLGEPADVLAQLAANIELLNDWIADSRVRFHAGRAGPGLVVLDFETLGYVGADLTALEFEGAGGGGGLRVVTDANLDGRPGAGDRELSGEWVEHASGVRFELDPVLELLPGWNTAERRVLPGSVAYRLFVTGGADSLPAALDVRPGLVNRLTGGAVELTAWDEGTAARTSTGWSPWRFPTATPGEIRLRGDVRLTEDLWIGPAETLVVEPGTTVRLAPDVSIVSRGLVLARGLEQRPIRFVQAEDGVPWGAFAIQGDGGDGSRFDHVEFVGGGGRADGPIVYKGMVSVHRARDVVFESVSFEDNLRSDDAFNAVHAEVRLRDCAFIRSNLDAIDFDFSGGEIVGCRFEAPGNDAIDLMGSPVLIAGNVIRGSGDKGISVGEASDPLIFNNRIERGERGIEIKDRSQPFILHNEITENRIGILQTVKNWRYGGGGWGKLAFTSVWDNEVDLASDPRSRLAAVGSMVGGEPVPPGAPFDGSGSWIYARFGIAGGTGVPGLLEEWRGRAPVDPFVTLRFPDTPLRGAENWLRAGGITRLEHWQDDLLATVRRREGSIAYPLELDLSDPGFRYVAVLEMTSSNLQSISVRFLSEDGEAGRNVSPGWDPALYDWVTVELPPGVYGGLAIELAPFPNTQRLDTRTGLMETTAGRLRIHSIDVFAIPGPAAE